MNAPESNSIAQRVKEFMAFLQSMRERLKGELAYKSSADVENMRCVVEEHYEDDQGKPAMYQRFESVFYDDAPRLVTLWRIFGEYPLDQLRRYYQWVLIELQGLTGDRHPRKVFDRSVFGIVALVVGTVTIWMTFAQNYTGENLSDLMELIRFNWVAGLIWVVGLFVVLWYILKVHRNNHQVAFLATLARALEVYLREHGALDDRVT